MTRPVKHWKPNKDPVFAASHLEVLVVMVLAAPVLAAVLRRWGRAR